MCHLKSVAALVSYAFCIQVFITMPCNYGSSNASLQKHHAFCLVSCKNPVPVDHVLDWVPKEGEEHLPGVCGLCCSGVLGML